MKDFITIRTCNEFGRGDTLPCYSDVNVTDISTVNDHPATRITYIVMKTGQYIYTSLTRTELDRMIVEELGAD